MLEARHRDWLAGDGIAQALDVLDARSRRIVEERWLKVNDDSSGGMTLHELAAEYGVSAERIRQIEVAAMKKMRKALAEAGLSACAATLRNGPARGRSSWRPFSRPSSSFRSCRQRLGAAAVAHEQAHLALRVEDVGAGGVVHRVAALGLARHLGVEDLELACAAACVCSGVPRSATKLGSKLAM